MSHSNTEHQIEEIPSTPPLPLLHSSSPRTSTNPPPANTPTCTRHYEKNLPPSQLVFHPLPKPAQTPPRKAKNGLEKGWGNGTQGVVSCPLNITDPRETRRRSRGTLAFFFLCCCGRGGVGQGLAAVLLCLVGCRTNAKASPCVVDEWWLMVYCPRVVARWGFLNSDANPFLNAVEEALR
jgi:hypothetical protein